MKSFKQHITEVNLRLQYHDTLNDKLWDTDKLRTEVRNVLLRFADTWAKFAGIPSDKITDVLMTGGNANYNYTPASDIDVHVVVDRDSLGSDRQKTDDYLQSKKLLWTMTHNIRVLGYPVEPYAQDVSEKAPAGQGVYSLKRDEWVQKPVHGSYDPAGDKELKRKVMFYAHMIDTMIKSNSDLESFDKLKKRISEMRSAGLARCGEFSQENEVFKSLRNKGYLDRMNKYVAGKRDEALSLK